MNSQFTVRSLMLLSRLGNVFNALDIMSDNLTTQTEVEAARPGFMSTLNSELDNCFNNCVQDISEQEKLTLRSKIVHTFSEYVDYVKSKKS